MTQPWWKKSVVYQIYPKSFYDTTGNGTGDLQGIIQKLPYLQLLGVDILWLTPVYSSPQNDNGYDISNYFTIFEPYGNMDDFEQLLHEAHNRDMKIMMDIVVNHTSTEHEWFKQARTSRDNRYRNYYYWKDGNNSSPPTSWKSKFGGSAWEYDEETKQYYLHLFDVTQADLNWENEELRQEIYEMMHYWLQKGVDGFRLDVINLISKNQDFPENHPPSDGREYYTDGPRIHEFLHEMNREVFSKYDLITVGEMSSTSIENCIKYSQPSRQELDMTFNFHHLKVDYENGEKWSKADFRFHELKTILSTWQNEMIKGGGWNALFWSNHDQPRALSRFGNDTVYHKESGKMLATVMHTLQGTPYIYQGEEIGMTNPNFDDINAYRDVESLNMYQSFMSQGMAENEILQILQQKSRDNGRTPMQWNAEKNAGFTQETPWIGLPNNYQEINVEAALQDEHSIFYHYQKLIKLRKKYDIIVDGDFQLILEDHNEIFSYIRRYNDEMLLVVNNFYGYDVPFQLPKEFIFKNSAVSTLISNYSDAPSDYKKFTLRPYESIVYFQDGICDEH